MVTVRVSSLSNGSTLIKAQSPAFTVCALISAICSSVRSALYSQSSSLYSFSPPTVLSFSTFPTHTSSGFENATLSTSATNFLVFSDTSMLSSVSGIVPASVVSATISSFSAASSEEFVSSIIPSTSTRSVKLTNPPPGMLNSYVLPSTP